MNIKNKIKNMIRAGAFAAAIMAPAQANAQVTGNIEAIVSENRVEGDRNYARLNGFYTLPADIKGYTFLEFYPDGDGFFGKTNLTRSLSKYFSLRSEVEHINEPIARLGIGGQFNVPMPKGSSASIKVLPFYVDKTGSYQENRVIVGYSVNLRLADRLYLGSFGESNVANKEGATWGYGEAWLKKELGEKGRYEISYNPALQSKGTRKIMPRLEHRIVFGVKF